MYTSKTILLRTWQCYWLHFVFLAAETTEDMPPLEGEDDDDTSKMEEVD